MWTARAFFFGRAANWVVPGSVLARRAHRGRSGVLRRRKPGAAILLFGRAQAAFTGLERRHPRRRLSSPQVLHQ
eukprot:4481403-Pyramimonas_sp.AAC.1